MQVAKRATSFVVAFALVAALLQLPSASGTSTIVKVEPAVCTTSVGEVITVNVKIVDVQNLYGVEVKLSWNSSIMTVIDLDVRLGESDGVLSDPIYVVQNETDQQRGDYLLAATSISPALPFNGSGNAVRITFNATGAGDCQLDLTSLLYDYPPPDRWPRVSLQIDHTTIDGSFTVISEFGNIIILLTLIILISLLLIFGSRSFGNSSRIVRNNHSKQGLLAKSHVTTWAGLAR